MEQNYSYEELLAKLELTIDNVENQKAWTQVIDNQMTAMFPSPSVAEIRNICRKVNIRGLYKEFQKRCKDLKPESYLKLFGVIDKLLPEYKNHLIVLSFRYAQDSEIVDFLYNKIRCLRTSDKFLIEQIPILLLSRCDENEKYVITACRRIKYFAERTTVFEKVFEYLEDFSVSNTPAALKVVTAITVNANNKDNFKLAMRLLRDFYIDYPSHIAAIREMLLTISINFDKQHHWRLSEIKELAVTLNLAWEENDFGLAKAMTDMLFKAFQDICYQPFASISSVALKCMEIIRSHTELYQTALKSINRHVDKDSPLYRELNLLLMPA